MARRRARESYPPPLCVAELDTAPVQGSVASPGGGLAFEMPAESAPARVVRDEPGRRPARATEVDGNAQANPWPFYLDQEVGTAGGGAPRDEDAKEGEVEQANPWPYHGPASGDDAPSATVYPRVRQQQGPRRTESLHGSGSGSDDAALQESLKHPGQTASPYPAPLRVSRPSSMATASPPPGIKPYCPPPGRDDVSAVGLGGPSSGAPPKPPIQDPHSPGVPYRPYRPPSISSASGATTAQSPSVMGTEPHHFYTPFSSDAEPMSPPKQRPDAVPDTEDKAPGQSPSIKPCSPPPPPPPPPKDDSPAASTHSLAQDAVPTPATTTSQPQSPPPVAMAHAQAPLAQPSPSVTPVSPHHTASPGMPPSPASSYDIQQSTYVPSPSLSPLPHQPRPQAAHACTDSWHTGYTSVSPPPAYPCPGPEGPDSWPTTPQGQQQQQQHPAYSPPPPSYPYPGQGGRPDSQPTPQSQQHPPYSPPPSSPYPPQPIYAAYTGQQNPPLPGGKPPPPLPPRRPNVSYGGFGGGPSNAANFPPPPKTHYNPVPPPYPPRPLGSGTSSTSLFSASSARKWLDKTSQVLESKLESVLQGPQGPPYRPAYAPGPPPQVYPHGPQTRGVPPGGYGYGPGPWGPGGPAPRPPPPGWRGPP